VIEEVAASLALQNMERDAPWTAWSKMLQLRGDEAVHSLAGTWNRMSQGRAGTAIPSHMKKMPFRLLSSVSKSSVAFRRKGRLGGKTFFKRVGAAGPRCPTVLDHGTGCSMDGLDQDDPASVPGMGMDLSYEKK
jgi:hypothetical protein